MSFPRPVGSAPLANPVAERIEALLREELERLGEDPAELEPGDIARHMQCEVHPDNSMVYAWRELPILRVVPEPTAEGGLHWRMFTRNEDDEA